MRVAGFGVRYFGFVFRRQRFPLVEEKLFHVLGHQACASFCQGIRRYSLRIIFIRSSQSFQAWAETCS